MQSVIFNVKYISNLCTKQCRLQ